MRNIILFFVFFYLNISFGNNLTYKSPNELLLILEVMPKNEFYYSIVTKLEANAGIMTKDAFIEISKLEIYKTLLNVETDNINYKNELIIFNSESRKIFESKVKNLKNPFLKWLFQSAYIDYNSLIGTKPIDDLNVLVKSNSTLDVNAKKLMKKIIILNFWYKKINILSLDKTEQDLINNLSQLLFEVLQNIENGLEIFIKLSPKKNLLFENLQTLPTPVGEKWPKE